MDTYTASNGITVSVHRRQPHLGYALYGPDGTNTLDLGFSHLNTVEMNALREFFQAEAAHKPWHDAKPGEAWLLTVDGEEIIALRDVDEDFCTTHSGYRVIRYNRDGITAGRRIWPEEDPS